MIPIRNFCSWYSKLKKRVETKSANYHDISYQSEGNHHSLKETIICIQKDSPGPTTDFLL